MLPEYYALIYCLAFMKIFFFRIPKVMYSCPTIVQALMLTVCLAGSMFCTQDILVAQEIKANVTVDMQLIPIERREDVLTMESDVRNYLNSQRYTGKDWEGEKIEVDVTITLMSRSGTRYTANLLINTKRTVEYQTFKKTIGFRFFEKAENWSFDYFRNASLTYQSTRFDDFSSLLDYYMMLAIGFDLDTYEELSGAVYFRQARDVWQMGASRNAPGYQQNSQPGEFTRFNLISELNDLKFEPFRKLLFSYYVDGLEMHEKNPKVGKRNIDSVLTEMTLFKDRANVRSTMMQMWFDSKFQELSDLFKGYDKKEVFQKLRFLDPSHSMTYERAETGR